MRNKEFIKHTESIFAMCENGGLYFVLSTDDSTECINAEGRRSPEGNKKSRAGSTMDWNRKDRGHVIQWRRIECLWCRNNSTLLWRK